MQVIRYSDEWAEGWNLLIKESKNGTFLFNRNYMDYHRSRFDDCSLIFAEGDDILGVLPANYVAADKTVYSHGGLTYGGLVLSINASATQVMQMVDEMIAYYAYMGAEKLIYKPIPYIYSKYPSEESLYAIFRHHARLVARGLSSTITLDHPLPLKKSRKDGIRKALNKGLYMSKTTDVEPFWHILDDVLQRYHNTHPVHSIDELRLLMSRFPKEIQLFVVRHEDKVIAGCLLFFMPTVIHVQYIAASDEGKHMGALDMLFNYLIREHIKEVPYLDFGISTENGGHILNKGLEFQKEGFGGRGVCYDQYEIDLTQTDSAL